MTQGHALQRQTTPDLGIIDPVRSSDVADVAGDPLWHSCVAATSGRDRHFLLVRRWRKCFLLLVRRRFRSRLDRTRQAHLEWVR